MILAAQDILWQVRHSRRLVIDPFEQPGSRFMGLSYGLGPAGYDVRIFLDTPSVDIEPGGFLLAVTVERVEIPDDLLVIVHDKSSWARRGIAVQNTVLEPGWRGYTTLELTNHSKETVQIYDKMPIAQFIFHKLTNPTDLAYKGSYQDQEQRPVESRVSIVPDQS
jgi:dCTP deaminase